ncbi:MAG: RNA polymerase sigma factor [Planctomycetes bacterium]|nr:RNA polymerase sigma factor [Planctomycetota bacterium]
MHVTLTMKRARRDAKFEELFEREQERIVRRLGRLPSDLVSLQCEIDLNQHLKEGYASLTLSLPTGKLNARGVGGNVLSALRDAVDDLLVELDRHKERYRRERRQRKSLRHEITGDLHGLLERIVAEEPADMAKVIHKTLGELYLFVRRELTRHREVLDRPECAGIDVGDVVEETVLTALSRRAEKPEDVPFDRWLFTCAYEVIVREEDQLAERNGSVSLEQDIEEVAPREGLTSGEEIFLDGIQKTRFFADVVPSQCTRSPDVEADAKDLHVAVMKAIRHLPEPMRKVLSLVALHGLAEQEAARRLSCSEENVRSVMADARTRVRAELAERGFEA